MHMAGNVENRKKSIFFSRITLNFIYFLLIFFSGGQNVRIIVCFLGSIFFVIHYFFYINF